MPRRRFRIGEEVGNMPSPPPAEPILSLSPPLSRRTAAVFSVAIFANATLLFSLEPMFGKMVLPALGGSAMVWTTCLLFFQAALLGGYLYARILDGALPPRWQPVAHIGLVIAAAAVLPFSIPAGWRPTNDVQPIWSLLALLACRVGPPFIVLSAGAPLIQRWYAATHARSAHTPYSLYAVSNVGSVGALLAYPFLVEPHSRLSTQAAAWSFGYAALLVLLVIVALTLRSSGASPALAPHARSPIPFRQRALWVALAAAPSSLLLGVTTHLSTDLAPIPLLWVVPLALYLLTFVVAFSERGIARAIVVAARMVLPYAVISIAALAFLDSELPGALGYAIHCVSLFVCALACHARLAETKPPERELTSFYLWLSLGGALGGVFNAIVAPLVFTGVAEYPIALVAAAGLSGAWLSPGRRRDIGIGAGWAVIVVGLGWALGRAPGVVSQIAAPVLVGLASIAVFSFRSRPLRFALGAAGVFLGAFAELDAGTRADFRVRSFYGVYRVVDDSSSGMRRLFSGTTVHGSELFADAGNTPLTYYHRAGPIGSLFALLDARPRLRVAIVGLGAGSMAAYSRPGDSWTFYEIDPLVARIALDTARFRFLGAAAARPSIVLGDARVSLAAAAPRAFDVIVIDAFSSDAIPVHLLTREAVALYRSRLADHGVIAWHISNRYLDLRPVVAGLAKDAGFTAMIDADLEVESAHGGRSPSIWVVTTADSALTVALGASSSWGAFSSAQASLNWTDDFSGVASLLHFGR
jgi:hypothetical protein